MQYRTNVEHIIDEDNENSKEESSSLSNSIKVLLADDDLLCNLAMRGLIEGIGKYQVFSFYNGVDVFIISFI